VLPLTASTETVYSVLAVSGAAGVRYRVLLSGDQAMSTGTAGLMEVFWLSRSQARLKAIEICAVKGTAAAPLAGEVDTTVTGDLSQPESTTATQRTVQTVRSVVL